MIQVGLVVCGDYVTLDTKTAYNKGTLFWSCATKNDKRSHSPDYCEKCPRITYFVHKHRMRRVKTVGITGADCVSFFLFQQ